MLKLLAMLFAWSAEISTCTNVDFLQTLAVAQSSIRDTVNDLGQLELQSGPQPVVSPWDGKYLCKYFHIHSETTPCHKLTEFKERSEIATARYLSQLTGFIPGRGSLKAARHERWVATVDRHFQKRTKDLRRNLEMEDDNNAAGADEPPRKRQRSS